MNKEKIKNNRVIRKIFYFTKTIIKRKELLKQALFTIESFSVEVDGEEKQKLAKDMLKTYSRTGFGFDEYICYGFQHKKEEERKEFVADWEHLGYANTLNDPKNDQIFDNKWKTYSKFGNFYGRKMLFCDASAKIEDFASFLAENTRYVIKPLDASCGRGVKIVENLCEQGRESDLFNQLLKDYHGRFLVEELIVQNQEIAKIHPSSVNTVRIPTIRMDDEVKVIHPFFRVGQKGNCVDNAGAGGIICCVDVETGKVYAAADEKSRTYVNHPDTHEKLIGFVIPRWEEAKQLVKKLAMVVPENRYTGWDVALTDKGWVLVEANRRGQFVWQIPAQEGFRKEINEILKKLRKKY